MQETQEIRSSVGQLHVTVFGAEGQGGLLREVAEVEKRVTDVEKRLNLISIKWLILTALVGVVGNAVGQKLFSIANFAHLLH